MRAEYTRRALLLLLLPLRVLSLVQPRRKSVFRGAISFATDGQCRWETKINDLAQTFISVGGGN